eukprot:15447458-Alexandrium_andersonii.AAC.1
MPTTPQRRHERSPLCKRSLGPCIETSLLLIAGGSQHRLSRLNWLSCDLQSHSRITSGDS